MTSTSRSRASATSSRSHAASSWIPTRSGVPCYHDVWTDAQFRNLEHSYGVALRGRYELGLVGAVGADFSREGYRVSYSLGTTR